jgi:hypothetical protein
LVEHFVSEKDVLKFKEFSDDKKKLKSISQIEWEIGDKNFYS